MALLDTQRRRGDLYVKICSWCKRVLGAEKEWLEFEDAVQRMNLLGAQEVPCITHSICPACKGEMEKKYPVAGPKGRLEAGLTRFAPLRLPAGKRASSYSTDPVSFWS